jgi:DNA sulfur modification protein DndE
MDNIRFKTSGKVEEMLNDLQPKLKFSTKAAVIRLAVAISLNVKGDPRESIKHDHENRKATGADYWRYTLTGDDDILYKVAIASHLKKDLSDEEYFPDLFNAHLERGILILRDEYDYQSNKDRLFSKFITEGFGHDLSR